MPCTPPCFSINWLTTDAISAPTTPPSTPSNRPMIVCSLFGCRRSRLGGCCRGGGCRCGCWCRRGGRAFQAAAHESLAIRAGQILGLGIRVAILHFLLLRRQRLGGGRGGRR